MNDVIALTPTDLRNRLSRVRRREQSWEYLSCVYLNAIEVQHCYKLWGFASVRQYAEIELNLSPRQTMERIRIARALSALPGLTRAMREGSISFRAVKEIARVATRATEDDWSQVARICRMRELERLVSASKEGEVPERPAFGLPATLATLSIKVTPEQQSLLEAAQKQYAVEMGREVSLAEVFTH